jgi:4-hydroxy-tetrahydrodipicolinate synthase
MLVQGIRKEGIEDRFRMFLGTRILIDAGAVIGAHGAIPATSNVAPAASAEAWEAAVRGDFAAAQQAVEIVAGYEDLVDIARGGSPDAASYASMKAILHEWGVIANPRLTRPLRSLPEDELPVLRERLQRLPHGSERRVAVAV